MQRGTVTAATTSASMKRPTTFHATATDGWNASECWEYDQIRP